MAAFALTDTSIYAGALDASCFGNAVEVTRESTTAEVTTFCSSGWREFVPALHTWRATFGGPQDLAGGTAASATHTPDEYYALNVGSNYPLMFAPSGAAEGSVAYGSQGILANYAPVRGSVGDALEHGTEWMPYQNTPLVRGVFATKQTVTATGNGTGHVLTAVTSAQRVYAGVHFLTAGGTTPSITVILESDDNAGFTSAATVATFSAQTARGAQWTSVAGPNTDNRWRFRWTVSGTSPSFQVRGFIGIL